MNLTRKPIDYFCRRVTATHEGKKLTVENFLTCLSGFDLYNDRLVIVFPDWTEEAFKNYGEPLDLFTKLYQLAGQQFTDFSTGNESVIASIRDKARILCNAPIDAQFQYFRLSVKDRTLEMSFIKNGESFTKNLYGDTYNAQIIADVEASTTENPSLVESAVSRGYGIAFEMEPEYWGTTTAITE